MKAIIETERLWLRELQLSDLNELYKILGDEDSMKYYPRPFKREEVEIWILRNIESYKQNNFGLWAVIGKQENIFLGECGITTQNIDGELLPELGYHIHKLHCNLGYATEAASACIRYAFASLGMDALYSYTKSDNIPSIQVAKKNGMKYLKSFKKEVLGETVNEVLYGIKSQS